MRNLCSTTWKSWRFGREKKAEGHKNPRWEQKTAAIKKRDPLTHPKFNSLPLKNWWKTTFLLEWQNFRGYVKLPGSTCCWPWVWWFFSTWKFCSYQKGSTRSELRHFRRRQGQRCLLVVIYFIFSHRAVSFKECCTPFRWWNFKDLLKLISTSNLGEMSLNGVGKNHQQGK